MDTYNNIRGFPKSGNHENVKGDSKIVERIAEMSGVNSTGNF